GVYFLDLMSTEPKPLAPGEKIALKMRPGQPVEVLDYPAIQRYVLNQQRERGLRFNPMSGGTWSLNDLPHPVSPAPLPVANGNGHPNGNGNGHNGNGHNGVPDGIAQRYALPTYTAPKRITGETQVVEMGAVATLEAEPEQVTIQLPSPAPWLETK